MRPFLLSRPLAPAHSLFLPRAFSPDTAPGSFANRPLVSTATLMALLCLPLPTLAQDAPAAERPTADSLPAVEVVGRSDSGRYQSGLAAGSKSDLPLRELPQSVRVMTRQAMDDLGAVKLDDLLDYVGGVSRQNSFGGLWDNLAIRGLAGNENTGMATLLNGFGSNRGFNAPRDLASVERIEFLKGPAAALYGNSEPGGTLNVVSKSPLWNSGHSLEGYVGSDGLRRVALDSTGPVSDRLAYRLNVAAEERDSFRDVVTSSRRLVAPAFTWRLSPDTTVDYRGEWLRHATPLDRGVVAVNNQLDVIPRERFLGEPADGDVVVTNSNHQLSLRHEWNESWQARVALSRRDTSIKGFSTEASALLADGTLRRQRRYRDYDSGDTAIQAELQHVRQFGGARHELLLGVEHYQFRMESLMLRVNPTATAPYAINIYNPVYGQAQPTPTANTDTDERQRNTAVYLQDAVSMGKYWRVLAGLRWEQPHQSLLNRRTGVTTSQQPSELSPRVGVSWLPDAQWTVYANAGRSFRPNPGSDFNGNAFAPEHSSALEAGLKWQTADQRLGATAAIFDIRKRDVLTTDPDETHSGYSVTAGEVRSRGIELEASGQLTPAWRINSSLTWLDAEVTQDTTLAVGSRLLNVPRLNASLLAVREGATSAGQRYGVGGGVSYTAHRLGQNGAPEFQLPSYAVAKLTAYWRATSALRLSLDVDNLFDRSYYTSSYSRLWVAPGNARSVSVGAQYKF
jgi:iron complex outermembrane recepter protein